MMPGFLDTSLGHYSRTLSRCFHDDAVRRHVYHYLVDSLKLSLGIVPYHVDLFNTEQPLWLRLHSKGAGDILNLVPLIQAILIEFPQCTIITNHWQLPLQYISPHCSVVPDQLPLSNQQNNYYDFTAIVNFHSYCPHWIQYFLLLKILPAPLSPDPFPLLPHRDLSGLGLSNKTYVVVHTRSERLEWQGRQTHPENMRHIIASLHRQGIGTVEVGNNIPLVHPASLPLLDKLSYEDLTLLIKHSAGFVGVDSLPMHLASLYRKPILGFFGATRPLQVLPGLTPVIPLSHRQLPCLGCVYERRPRDFNVCPFGDPPCQGLFPAAHLDLAAAKFCRWLSHRQYFENLAADCLSVSLDYVVAAGHRDFEADLHRRVIFPLRRPGFARSLTGPPDLIQRR